MLFRLPSVQQRVSRIASDKLEEKLGTRVEIGSVELELFNKIVLKDLLLEDQAGDTLFSASRFSVGFELFPLFKKQLIFSSAQLFTFQLHLNKENEDAPLNIQFVLDAFADKDTVKKDPFIDLNIHTLNIRRGQFTYHVKSAPATHGVFNAKHLAVGDISAKMRLNKVTNDSINIQVNKLSMREQSGLEIKRVLFDIAGSSRNAEIKKFQLWLPNSHLHLNAIRARFPEDVSPDAFILNTYLSFDITNSEIAPGDLKALAPELSNYKDKLHIDGHVEGTFDKIAVSDFEVSDEGNLSFLLDVSLSDLSSPQQTYIDGYVKRFYLSAVGLQRTINNFSSREVTIPGQLSRLDGIGFNGAISGYFKDLMAYGDFSTQGGVLNVDVNIGKDNNNRLFIKGLLKTKELDLEIFFPENSPYGKAVFQVELDARQDSRKKFAGVVNADLERLEIKNHVYENIRFAGDFTHSSFNGKLEVKDDYGLIEAEGLAKLNGKDSEFNFAASVKDLKLDKLNLTEKYKDSNLSFFVEANFRGGAIDDVFGELALREFAFQLPENDFYLDSLCIEAQSTDEGRHIKIQSDIIQAVLSGTYSYSDLIPSMQGVMHQYLPALIKKPADVMDEEEYFNLDVTVENTEKLSAIFNLPLTIYEQSSLKGRYRHSDRSFLFNAKLPKYSFGNIKMENTDLSVHNSGSKAELNVRGIRYGKFDVKTDFTIYMSAKDNLLENLLSWRNQEEALYEGELFAKAQFSEPQGDNPTRVDIQLKPTHLVFNDTIWTVYPAEIKIDEKITINNLNAEHLDQYIRINGVVSKDTTDNLMIQLNKMNLDYIFNSLTIPALELGGVATGNVLVNDVYGAQKLSTSLDVKNFSFNDAELGDLELSGMWDNERQGIVMLGKINKNDAASIAVDGIILPSQKELSIYFDAKNANARFLRKYLDGVAPGFTGDVTGRLHLHGNFKNITVAGSVMVRNGGFGIDFLNTFYTFNDSVYLDDENIRVSNMILNDKDGHTALANASVSHSYFKGFKYKADIQTDNFLVYNGSESKNPSFFGTAYGTGKATISGMDDDVNIDISIRTNEKTKISLNFMEQSDINEYDFINFVSRDESDLKRESKTARREGELRVREQAPGGNIKMNLALDATSDAQIEFFVDPVSGDKIKAWGKGKLRIEYGTHIEPRIYGNYTLDRGVYNFSLQQVIFRDFYIKEGSSLTFRGDPYGANLDISAIYPLSASLTDLDPSFSAETPMNTILVHCILGINGELEHPTIKFDLKLPHSTSDLERQVKNIISTDEMMNRQMIFLLALGRFYTQGNTISSSTSNDFANVASSTLSSQLNSLLGSLSENFQIGTNIRTSNYDEYSDTEVKLLLSSQLLNNRLVINGNFGYKDNPVSEQRFIGDFDLEYKLTKMGDIRLKAYNHYNDKYYYLKTTTKQGVGVMFRRDFDSLYDLFKIKRTRKREEAPAQNAEADIGDDFIRFREKDKKQP